MGAEWLVSVFRPANRFLLLKAEWAIIRKKKTLKEQACLDTTILPVVWKKKGKYSKYEYGFGMKMRMHPMAAALALCQLEKMGQAKCHFKSAGASA